MSDGMGAEPISIFTLWPEWRDYDPTIALIQGVKAFHHIFTLWPEWRDYDTKPPPYVLYPTMYFYLVTWMKGLRHQDRHPSLAHQRIFTLWPEWRDYDILCSLLCNMPFHPFLPCDLNEGITTRRELDVPRSIPSLVFTLWPEWRDYDLSPWVPL